MTFCTIARIGQKAEPTIESVILPALFDVATTYGIRLAARVPEAAREFVRYVLSQRAQMVMEELGCSAPAPGCDELEEVRQ